MHRLAKKFLGFFKRQVRPSLCADCKEKMDRKFGLVSIRHHHVKHRRNKRRSYTKRRGISKAAARARFKKLLPRINAGRRKKGLKPIHLK
ncbi:MAG: hypothetical protein KGL95_13515 [Patescibacteria group bacterium]|nr:hypothetical protein [Patescibacteria group bacterium]